MPHIVNPGSSGGGSGSSTISVANVAALAGLDASSLGEGTLVYVSTYKAFFALVTSTQTTAINVRVTANGNAGHIWDRCLESGGWWSQLTWWVDPSNISGLANDENSGASAILPLLTYAELGRRMFARHLPPAETSSYTVNQMSNGVANDFATFDISPFYRGNVIAVSITGTVIPITCGTITIATTRNPATNTANVITVPGFDFSAHIGKNVRVVGTITTGIIEAAPSLGYAQLGEQFVGSTGLVGSGFVVGNTIEIASLTTLLGATFRGTGVQFSVNDMLFPNTNIRCDSPFGPGVILRRCQLVGGAINCSSQLQACSTSGNINIYGSCSATSTSVVSGTTFLFTPLAAGTQSRHHWTSCGTNAASIGLDDASTLRLASDFHAFNMPANIGAVSMRYGAQVYGAGNYYGSGNNVLSAGVIMMGGNRWYFPVGTPPTMDAGLGLYYDGTDNGVVPLNGSHTALGQFPALAGGFAQLTAKASAMISN